MKASEYKILRQIKVSKTTVPNTIINFKKSTFKGSKKIGHPSIFSSGNKRFVRKRVSQSSKSSAEKIQAKVAQGSFKISEKTILLIFFY